MCAIPAGSNVIGAVTQSGTWTQTITGAAVAAAAADGTSNPTTLGFISYGFLYNGTTWDRIRGDTTYGQDVDVTRLPGSLVGLAEDTTAVDGAVGLPILVVRRDSAASGVSADGDWANLSVDSVGALRVTGATAGTQYTEGDTDSTITGTALLWEDTSDTLRAASVAKPLPTSPVVGGAVISSANGMPATPATGAIFTVAPNAGASWAITLAGNVYTTPVCGTVAISGSELTVKYAKISCAASGDNTLVAAVTSKKIRILELYLISTGTVNVYFADGASTALIGDSTNKLALVANKDLHFGPSQFGITETASGQLLKINLSGAVGVSGYIVYVEV
jgi:hypothetical protein